ncbi:MAG: tyrosine-type recombinase/integrase [Intrasporangium sp.]|uniref:tyrosine-type recombinase/integrase n=1 Tax=Intrasporangium sp. TaxID=1925024 RepID=UPI002647DC88|nr:tyrosine-type recombinase/integrase [Intrasporangium sp.]MDN5798009.1 tyrosine-type recombinase/integrase [Intrasporangium sp.]
MATTPIEVLMERYATFLLHERGLQPNSAVDYVRDAMAFLGWLNPDGGLGLGGLSGGQVIEYVRRECAGGMVGHARRSTVRLRALLRFLFLDAAVDTPLAELVPSVANRRDDWSSKAISPAEAARLLDSCDRTTAVGRRDFAVLTVLSRLGLRAGEVAGLRLEDIDWRGGQVVIRGKGDRVESLPLPSDVGEAVVGWLQAEGPRGECRCVFTRMRAPMGGLSTAGVSRIVVRACARAGLPRSHAHRLRHFAATEMLRAGASLTEVGQVMRHTPSSHHIGLRHGRSARPVRGHPPLAGGCAMSDLAGSLQDYLAVRRAVGFRLKTEERMLADFVRYARQAGVSVVTTEVALAWARLPELGSAHWLARRLRMVRGFARYLNAIDPSAEIPPVDLLVGRHHRPAPHLYSDAETAALLRATDDLRPALRSATMHALIGLLAVSGVRVGEAIRINREDVNWAEQTLLVHDSKNGGTRLLPCMPAPSRRCASTAASGTGCARTRPHRACSSPLGVPGWPTRRSIPRFGNCCKALVWNPPRLTSDARACTISAIRWTAGLCALSECSGWSGWCRGRGCPHNPGGQGQRVIESSQPISEASVVQSGKVFGVRGS